MCGVLPGEMLALGWGDSPKDLVLPQGKSEQQLSVSHLGCSGAPLREEVGTGPVLQLRSRTGSRRILDAALSEPGLLTPQDLPCGWLVGKWKQSCGWPHAPSLPSLHPGFPREEPNPPGKTSHKSEPAFPLASLPVPTLSPAPPTCIPDCPQTPFLQ